MLIVGWAEGVVLNPRHALKPKVRARPSNENWESRRQKKVFIEMDGAQTSAMSQEESANLLYVD